MPSTRSGSSASGGAGEGEDSARLLEEAAAELSSEIAARKATRRRAINVESRKKAIGGKSEAKRSVESMHFENHPATPRSHVRVE